MIRFKQIKNLVILVSYRIAIAASVFLLVFSIGVHASESAPESCKSKNKNITNLFVVTQNYPIIPADCSQNKDGGARALSPEILPDIAINAYYFLVSLGFTMIGPVLAISGFLYYNAGISDSDPKAALSFLKNSGIALLLLIFASVIPATLTQIFSISGSQNLNDYFQFK